MSTPENNPFILPGFGQPGQLAQNPMLASMEMMRKAWENLAGGTGLESAVMQSLSPEDLERRIQDLRAVENWLRMNLSMLSSTIQGMEVQRATVATLRSFVASAGNTPTSSANPHQASPLEVALGLRPASTPQAPETSTTKAAQPQSAEPPAQAASAPPEPAGSAPDAAFAGAAAAAQGWWDMLQKQFDSLAAATSAGMQNAEALKQTAAKEATPAARPKRAAKTARKTAARKSVNTTTRRTATTARSKRSS